jgi:hypothetical protein
MRAHVIAVLVASAAFVWAAPVARAGEVYYKFQDERGHWHYSNAPSPTATEMFDLGERAGPVEESEPAAQAPDNAAQASATALERYKVRRAYRSAERELRQIDTFFRDVRQRQRERLESFAVRQILEDWEVADRATELSGRREELQHRLDELRTAERRLVGG